MRILARALTQTAVRACARMAVASGGLSLLSRLNGRWRYGPADGSGTGVPRVRRRREVAYQILLYHRVMDDTGLLLGGTPVSVFARQMAMLRRLFTVLPLDELIERGARNDLPDNAVAVTFDDGYRDNYEHAFPVLAQLSIPATIFLATGSIGSGRLLWHDALQAALLRTHEQALLWRGRHLDLGSRAAKRRALYVLLETLWTLEEPRKVEEVGALVRALAAGEPDARSGLMLGWDQIREMARHRIAFGAHTVTHPILTRLPIDRVRQEVRDSIAAIERELGSRVKLFAYPNGRASDFDDAVKAVVRETGCAGAVTTVWGANSARTDRFALRRVAPWEHDPASLALKLHWYRFVDR